MPAPAATFTVRHVQLARAALAAIAALMITFSPDHSAPVGLSVFSGFIIATALVLLLATWLVAKAGGRWHYVLLGVIGLMAGIVSGIPPLRTTETFFVVLISWAALSGLVELLAGIRVRRDDDPNARDMITVGALTLLLAVVLLAIPPAYSLGYTIEEAGSFTLTGIILGVGVFGAYAAIVAVYLAIAGLSPRRTPVQVETPAAPEHGGVA